MSSNNNVPKSVCIVGSSGGGGSNLSQDMYGLLTCLKKELTEAGIGIAAIQVVECDMPLDFAPSSRSAALWVVGANGQQIERLLEGSLYEVNQRAATLDRAIGRMIIGDETVKVDGMISISSDVTAVNSHAFAAAAKTGIPVVGTGGTSLGAAAAMNLNVIGNSGGSVSTTTQSKAISFTASLAGYWNLPYTPSSTYVSLHSVLGGCLPAFMAVMLFNRLAQDIQEYLPKSIAASLLDMSSRSIKIIPICVSSIMASQVGAMGETAIIAGLVAGVLMDGPVLLGVMTGVLAGYLCRYILVATARSTFVPATASTITTAGVSGILSGLIGHLCRPLVIQTTSSLKAILDYIETPGSGMYQIMIGAIIGLSMCYGSQVGGYHLIFLPLICFEMQDGQPSFLGAVDFCSLCLVSAGICTAYFLVPPSSYSNNSRGGQDNMRPLARRGLFINFVFGDFVEACYPMMENDVIIKASAYAACMISTVMLLNEGPARSSAYLPFPVSLYLANGHATSAASMAFGLPFTIALLKNIMSRLLY